MDTMDGMDEMNSRESTASLVALKAHQHTSLWQRRTRIRFLFDCYRQSNVCFWHSIMGVLDVIFPTARAALLRTLLVDDQEIYLRELVRRTGLNLRTVQRELELLTRAEILTSRRDGNRQYFRANRDNPVYPELRGLVLKDGAVADLLRQALKEVSGIDIAFIFGSVAQGTEKAGSDVDLFIIGDVGLRQLTPLLMPVSEAIRREINPYNISVASWRQKLQDNDAFAFNVAQSRKIFLIGSRDDFERLASQWLA